MLVLLLKHVLRTDYLIHNLIMGQKLKALFFQKKIKVKVEPYPLSLIALQKGILCQHKINGL